MHVLDDARAHHQVTLTERWQNECICCQLSVGSYTALPNRSYLLAVAISSLFFCYSLACSFVDGAPPTAINKKELILSLRHALINSLQTWLRKSHCTEKHERDDDISSFSQTLVRF